MDDTPTTAARGHGKRLRMVAALQKYIGHWVKIDYAIGTFCRTVEGHLDDLTEDGVATLRKEGGVSVVDVKTVAGFTVEA